MTFESNTAYGIILDSKFKTNSMNAFDNEETIIIETFNDSAEATAAKDKLEAVGIVSMLVDENVVGLNPLGGIELKIFQKDEARAREVLAN